MHYGKRKLWILLFCIGILLITLGTCSYLAFGSKVPAGNMAASSSAILDSVRKIQAKGGKLEVTAEEINGVISDILKKPMIKKDITIKGVYLDIKNNDMVVYVSMKYKSFNLLPNIKGSIEYKNDKMIFRISAVRLGNLRLPCTLVMDRLKKYSNEDVSIEKDRIEVNKYVLPFNTKNIYIKDGKIVADIQRLNTDVLIPVQGKIQKSNTNNLSDLPDSKKTVKTSTSPIKNKNTAVLVSSLTGSKSPNTKILKDISGQLNGALNSVQSSKEREIISTIQSVMNKVSSNPNYPYQAEANWVKSNYKKLPRDGQARIKGAILSNVDITKVFRLVNIFGI
jgi:hypothetical protein